MDVRRQVIMGVASLAMVYGGGVYAVGLGEIQLNSALHQPLDATIVLHGTDGLAPDDIVVSLADASAFTRVGIDRPNFLTLLRFTPLLQGGNLVVRVQSNAPVVEPYLNFLLQLKRPNGNLLREYTLLLDPPLYQPTAVVAAAPLVFKVQRNDTLPASRSAKPELPQLQPDPRAAHYQSRSGDNLWAIAKATRSDDSIPVRRQMLAIRALNPEAFVDGDMDRLRAGQQLALPTTDQVVGNRRAEVATTSASIVPAPARTVTAEVVSSTVETNGRLRIEEQLDSQSSENAELQERLATLETRFSSLLEELDARDRQIASLQAELDVLRRARDAELASPGAGIAQGSALESTEGSAGSSLAASNELVVGAFASETPDLAEFTEVSNETQRFSIMNWWPALLALLAAIAGAIIFRLGRVRSDVPQSASVQPAARDLVLKSTDPVAGAELYVAYGRYAEARVLLDKAISTQPERLDLRLRQLAVLAQLGDQAGFAAQEFEVRHLGGDIAHIQHLKKQFNQQAEQPVMHRRAGDPQATPSSEQSSESEPISDGDGTQVSLLNQDEFSLDPDWSLLDDLDPSGARRQARAADDQLDEAFETNLNDYPEVGELDDPLSEHFSDSMRKPSDS